MKKEQNDYRYIQFPLCLIQETYMDINKGLRLIMAFGIMNYAMRLQYNMENVASQLIYDYIRNRDELQPEIVSKLDVAKESGSILFKGWASDYYPKRSSNDFEDALEQMSQLIELDSPLKESAVLNYKLHLATSKDHLSIRIASYGSIMERFKIASQKKQEFENKFGSDAMPFCKPGMLLDFKDKQQDDLDLFRAYIGIKSMLGRRSFISTNKPAILSRMIGCKSKAAFEYYTTNKYNKNKTLLPTVEKYSKRYHMDKLLVTLVQRKYIMYYPRPNISVIYVSKYMEPEALVRLVRETKDKQDFKKRIRDAEARLDLEQRMNNNEQA